MTVAGQLLGTPAFMSPEQARGDVRAVDRRSDVYSLGATLYAVLTDRPPFEGSDVLRSVREDVPRGPRDLRPEIPRDVDSITMKCLNKRADDRYGSARALAEDLGRYLDGEPVQARPVTRWYRWRMKMSKHRLEVGTAAVGAALLLSVSAWGLRERVQSVQRSRVAQEFGQRVERIDSIARYSALAPLHDTTPAKELIREEMAAIERQMGEVGAPAHGPGHYALGRGYLALESYDEARFHVEQAWAAGYREPAQAYLLGLVMGELYLRALREADQSPSAEPSTRELREIELRRERMEREYRDPALEYLRQVDGDGHGQAYGGALLAYFEGEWETALAKARSAFQAQPWAYECRQLEGEIHVAMAREREQRGELEATAESVRAAESAFEDALRIGSSDAGLYLALGSLYQRMMFAEVSNRGHDVEPSFEKGLDAVERCLTAHPQNADALLLRAVLHRRMAEYRKSRGEDPTENLRSAATALARSLEVRPENAAAFVEQGSTYRLMAAYEQGRGEDPGASFAKATRAFEEAERIDPTRVSSSSLGLLFHSQARWQLSRGEDPRHALGKAVEALREGLTADSLDVGLWNNLGNAYSTLASYLDQIGQDPTEAQDQAIEAFRAGLSVNPNQAVLLYGLGLSLNQRSWKVLKRGGDPAESLAEALEAYSRALDINPQSAYVAYFRDGLGFAYSLRADFERAHGFDPLESFRLAEEEFRGAIEANPKHIFSCVNLALLLVSRAEHALDVGGDPRAFLDESIRWGEEALRINASHSAAHVVLAESYRVQARELTELGQAPDASLHAAREAARQSLEINPSEALAHVCLGRVSTLEARWRIQRGEDPSATFEDAKTHLQAGIDLDPDDVGGYVAMAELCRRITEWSSRAGRSSQEEADLGLRMTEKALGLCAGHGESLALQATLLLLLAEPEPEGAQRKKLLQGASDSLDRALDTNRHLRRRYAAEATRIHELAGA